MLPICFLFSFAAMHICKEWGVRVCGIAVLGYFWCGVAVIFISKYVIAVFRVQAPPVPIKSFMPFLLTV